MLGVKSNIQRLKGNEFAWMKTPRIDIRFRLLVGIVLMIFDALIEKISIIFGRKAQIKMETAVRRKPIEIEDISKEEFSTIDTNYLLVRFGVSEFIEQDPAAQEKRKMKIRNRKFPVDTRYDDQRRTIEATIPLRVHKNLPTEFKLFLEVEDATPLEMVKNEFESSPSRESASIADSLEDRVFILQHAFETTETPDGFQNNVVYPK